LKHAANKYIAELFGKPRRGQHRTPTAESMAQRQREFRQRQKFNFLASATRDEK
jgi:hypothetical protein